MTIFANTFTSYNLLKQHNMKRIKYLLLYAFTVSLLTACIKDEPQFRETDIQSFIVEGDKYISTPSISQNTITVLVHPEANFSALIPIIELPEGATVFPESGIAQDFSKGPVSFKVTAENSTYSREYLVTVITSIPLTFDFENWSKNSTGFHELMVLSGGKLVKVWDSGNSGVSIIKPEIYPTRPTDVTPYSGTYAAMLETRYGGLSIGNRKIPIFSGSLFYGQFEINLADPRKSLKLGQSHSKEQGRPVLFTGYYKYTPGKPFVYLDGDTEVQSNDITDEFAFYSLLYKVKKGNTSNEWIDGTMIHDDKRIIARAEWKKETSSSTDSKAEKGYTNFIIPFEYTEEIDYSKYDYKLVILFSSSKDGDLYRGGIGSTLLVDDVDIVCEKIN